MTSLGARGQNEAKRLSFCLPPILYMYSTYSFSRFLGTSLLFSQPASSIHEWNFSCFYILEWDKVGIWVYLPHNSFTLSASHISYLNMFVCFFLFYRIMIIPPVVSFGTLISLSSNFSQKSYIPSCINTDYIPCPIHLNVWVLAYFGFIKYT